MQIQFQESTNQLVSKSVEQPAVPEFTRDFGRKDEDKSELKWYTLEGFLKRFYLPFLKKPATKVLPLFLVPLFHIVPQTRFFHVDMTYVCESWCNFEHKSFLAIPVFGSVEPGDNVGFPSFIRLSRSEFSSSVSPCSSSA